MVVKQKGQLVDGHRCDSCGHLFTETGEAQYECSRCGSNQVGDKRCASCNIFMSKVADETCPECEDGQDIHKVELFEAPDGELFTDEQSWKNYVKDTPKRKRREAAAKKQLDKDMEQYRRRREAEKELRNQLLVQALPALLRHMPKMVETYDLKQERWRRDTFLTTSTVTVDPEELLWMASVLNRLEERHGV